MTSYKIHVEVIVLVDADTIDEAEGCLKNRFNTKDTTFYQLIDYKEIN